MNVTIKKKIETFFNQYSAQTFQKGEILIRADEDPSGIYFMKSGYVKSYLITKKGEQITVNLFKPVSFFPMSWAINDSKNMYFYEAMTLVTIYKAPKTDVISFIKENNDVLYDLLNRVYSGIDGVMRKMAYLMEGSAYERLIVELIMLAKRFGKSTDDTSIYLHFNETDIANQTGLTRETISRELKKLKEKKLISSKPSTLIIPNIIKLEEQLIPSL